MDVALSRQVFTDLHAYMLSLRRVLALAPEVIYPAHGPVVRDPASHVAMYIAHRNAREQQILATVKEAGPSSVTIGDIVSSVYPVGGGDDVTHRVA